MRLKRFTTDAFPARQRPTVWLETLLQHHLRSDIQQHRHELFGTVVMAETPRGIGLTEISSSPQNLARVRAERASAWLAVHLDGDAFMTQGDQPVRILPGDIVYGSADATAGLQFCSNFRQFLVHMPQNALPKRLLMGSGQARHLQGQRGLGRMLGSTLSALSESLESLGDEELPPVEQMLTEFVASALAQSEAEGSKGVQPRQMATLQRIMQRIEQELSDPGLTLAALANHEGISERSLQKLFEGIGQTFSGFLRTRRLERCRTDLGNRLYGHLSISDICFRWGFNDAAHFSHAFREHYQISPRQFRQQAKIDIQHKVQRASQRGWPADHAISAAASAIGTGDRNSDGRSQSVCSESTVAALKFPSAAQPVTHHYLAANENTIHWGYFSRNIPAVLSVASGDIVTVETLTQHAYDDYDRMIKGDSGAESVFYWTPERKNVDRRGAGPINASIYGRGSGEGFGVHICTGPIHVKGAMPGDILEVRILDLMPRLSANAKFAGRAFGSNAAAWWGFHYDDLLTEPKPREVVTIYEIHSAEEGNCAHAVYNFRWTPQRDPYGVLHATIDYPGVPIDRSTILENHGVLRGVHIPTRPHFGVIAVAPVESGIVDSVPPAYFGGNIDNWRVGKGASVYLRVGVAGALLSVGDPHASQGDSELCGTAIECSLTGVFQLVLHKASDHEGKFFSDIDSPLVETAEEWVLQGFSHPDYLREFGDKARSEIYAQSSLDLAMRDAFRKARSFLMTSQGLSEDEAISLMSVAVDFGVTQVVDGNWGVHAIIRKALFQNRGSPTATAEGCSTGGPTTEDKDRGLA